MRALVDPVRMVDGRLASVCSPCAATMDAFEVAVDEVHEAIVEVTLGPQSRQLRCSCGAEIALHEARHVVTTDGAIATRCTACINGAAQFDSEPAPMIDDTPVVPQSASPGRSRWLRYAGAAGLVLALAAATRLASYDPSPAAAALAHPAPPHVGEATAEPAPPGDGADVESADEGQPAEHPELEGYEDFDPLEPTLEDLLEESGGTVEEMFPTLADWVFPVEGYKESFPLRKSRRFGAEREGVRRPECRQGHCGVDLGGERGTPIVAVAWGKVSRIQRDEDRASGMYVRLEHPDFVYTYYMHLDSIASDLELGDEVQPGQLLGTLGSTGILFSAPHLHFSLEIPQGDRPYYIDPAPFLRRAVEDQGG